MKRTEANPSLTYEQKKQLLERMFARANSGDVQMLIHLGQTEMGQVKAERVIHEHVPELSLTLTYDELLQMVEERQQSDVLEGECSELPQSSPTVFIEGPTLTPLDAPEVTPEPASVQEEPAEWAELDKLLTVA